MTRVTELTPLLKRLQLGPMAATLPERIALARREQLDYASFLEIILSDEVNRRAQRRIELRLNGAGFEETCRLVRHRRIDWSASITLDRCLLDAVFSLEFLDKHEHVLLVGPPESARAFSPRPWATQPSAPATPCVSSTPMTSSRPWHKPEWTTPWTVPSGPS